MAPVVMVMMTGWVSQIAHPSNVQSCVVRVIHARMVRRHHCYIQCYVLQIISLVLNLTVLTLPMF
jgi:hypothetical protein